MYKSNIRNQAVIECVNGNTIAKTATKYDVNPSTLALWMRKYKEKMKQINNTANNSFASPEDKAKLQTEAGSKIKLKSMLIDINGQQVTVSKEYIERLMGIFKAFDE